MSRSVMLDLATWTSLKNMRYYKTTFSRGINIERACGSKIECDDREISRFFYK